MIFIDFPITGEFRFILMIFEWIFSIICLEFGILFTFRLKKEQYKFKYSQDFGYIILFFTLSMSRIFSVLGSYFSYSLFIINLYNFISYMFLYSGFLSFFIVKERQQIYLLKKYFFSISLLFLLIVFTFSYFLNNQLIIIESIILISLIYLFFVFFFSEFIKKAKIKSNLLIEIIIIFLPFLLLLIGLFLTSYYSIGLLVIQFRLIGSLLQLIGITFFAFFFLKFPIYSEYDWKDKIEEVFLINQIGACVFYKSYIQKMDLLNKHLITSAITSVNILLKEILKPGTMELSIIKKKGKLIYIFPSELITGVIFSKKESRAIELHIKQLVIKVEQVYKNILKSWDGDLDIFNPIKDIYKELFST